MQPRRFFLRLRWYTEAGVTLQIMDSQGFSIGHGSRRRALAIVACVALLYFVAGAIFLHEHTSGEETACPVCQALHMPALAAASLALIPEAEQIARHSLLAKNAAPLDAFSLQRASRAPPAV
jgi:Protein of unknown function (DUF2946)